MIEWYFPEGDHDVVIHHVEQRLLRGGRIAVLVVKCTSAGNEYTYIVSPRFDFSFGAFESQFRAFPPSADRDDILDMVKVARTRQEVFDLGGQDAIDNCEVRVSLHARAEVVLKQLKTRPKEKRLWLRWSPPRDARH